MPTDADIAIQVERVSKSYRLAHEARADTLRDAVMGRVRGLFSGRARDTQPAEEFWALSDVSFDLPKGEVLGIVGRNGAGKSTLLKVLSRITEPTRGRIVMRGRVASLLEVGTGFHPELTGRENIYLNGGILGLTRAEIRARFDAIVDFAEVSRFLDTPVKHYSSGMYVRLAFAVAAHLEPEILIVDEVLAVGDAEFQRKCIGKMGEVAGGGRTVLFVSHNLSAVRALCTRAILMEKGRCVAGGTVDDVLARYTVPVGSGAVAYRAPGNPKGPHIASARIVTSSGSGRHEAGAPLVLEVTFATSGNPDLALSLHVGDSRFEEAVHSSSEFGAGRYDPALPLVSVRATLPAALLNVGDYQVTLALGQRNSAVFDRLENGLSFTVVDTAFAVPGTHPGEWRGASSPRSVNWEWSG
jgi:lipopolysaccharide transport system ATP-binding protein